MQTPLQIPTKRLPLLIGAIWIVASLLLLARIPGAIWSLLRIRRRAAAAPFVYLQRVRELSRRCGVSRSAGIAISEDLRTPVAAGLYRPAILIPAALLPRLTESEFDQIAIHELAHLRRWDDWANLIERIAAAVFVFHPAVRFIVKQLDLEREIACDDFVLQHIANPRDYACCLTRLIEITGRSRGAALAPGAAVQKSQIVRRVEKLLDSRRDTRSAIARRAVLAMSALLAVFVLAGARVPAMWAFAGEATNIEQVTPPTAPAMTAAATPSAALPPAPPAPALLAMASHGDGQSYSYYSSGRDNKHIRMKWTQNWRSFDLDAQGDIEFTDDDHDVKSLSAGGWLRMEEQGSPDRRYEVRADSSGRLTRTYFESGHEVSMDDGGRRWLADRIPEVVRETGVDAAKRVQRILHQRGPDTVEAEIRLIRSDGSKRLYLQEFLLHGNLDETHLRAGMRLARDVSSDGEKAALLTQTAPLFLKGDLRRDLFETVDTISSDGEHARALAAFVSDDPTNSETLLLAARSAGRISSDGEKARLLIALADRYKGNEQMHGAWFKTLDSVSSDGEKRSALSAIIARDGRDRDTLVEALKSAAGISSDGERARLLVESSQYYIEDGAIRRNFFAALDGISSDGEKRQALSALYQRANRNPATVQLILRSAKGISSDGEKAAILSEVAGPMTADPVLRDDFFAACDSISSDGEHARVLSRATDSDRNNPAALVKLIASATRISSDGEKYNVLARVIALGSKDPSVRAALRKGIESVSSDGESRKLWAALAKEATV
jgi:beta-lactamase regulating signal transducer with metallopeptidase domain